MNSSAQKCGVYVLRLATHKHFYIGATIDLKKRLQKHRDVAIDKPGSAFPTKTYGFSGEQQDVVAFFPCESMKEAVLLENRLVRKYIALCPDTAIFGDGVTFNSGKPLHPEECRTYLHEYASF
jgi:predicted GIY-YIG superfamily endonuclease